MGGFKVGQGVLQTDVGCQLDVIVGEEEAVESFMLTTDEWDGNQNRGAKMTSLDAGKEVFIEK